MAENNDDDQQSSAEGTSFSQNNTPPDSGIAPESLEATSSRANVVRPAVLRIRTLTEREESVEVDLNEPLRTFREKLRAVMGIELERQRIIFQGKVLSDDNATLASFGLNDGHTVHVVDRPPQVPSSQPFNQPGVRTPAQVYNLMPQEFIPIPALASFGDNQAVGIINLMPSLNNISVQQTSVSDEGTPTDQNPPRIVWRLNVQRDSNTTPDSFRQQIQEAINSLTYLPDDIREQFNPQFSENEIRIDLPNVTPHVASPALERLNFVESQVHLLRQFREILQESNGLLEIIRDIAACDDDAVQTGRYAFPEESAQIKSEKLERVKQIASRLEQSQGPSSMATQLALNRLRDSTPAEYEARMQFIEGSAISTTYIMRHAIAADYADVLQSMRAEFGRFSELETIFESLLRTNMAYRVHQHTSNPQEDYRTLAMATFHEHLLRRRHVVAHLSHTASEIDLPIFEQQPQRLLPQYDINQLDVPNPHSGSLIISFRDPPAQPGQVDQVSISTIFPPPRRSIDVGFSHPGEWPYMTFYPIGIMQEHHELQVPVMQIPIGMVNADAQHQIEVAVHVGPIVDQHHRQSDQQPTTPQQLFDPIMDFIDNGSSSMSADLRDSLRAAIRHSEAALRSRQQQSNAGSVPSSPSTTTTTSAPSTPNSSSRTHVASVPRTRREFLSSAMQQYAPPLGRRSLSSRSGVLTRLPPRQRTRVSRRGYSEHSPGPDTETLTPHPPPVRLSEIHRVARIVVARYRETALRRIAEHLFEGFRDRTPSWNLPLHMLPTVTMRQLLSLALEFLTSSSTNADEATETMSSLVRDENLLVTRIIQVAHQLFVDGTWPPQLGSSTNIPRNSMSPVDTILESIPEEDRLERPTDQSFVAPASARPFAQIRISAQDNSSITARNGDDEMNGGDSPAARLRMPSGNPPREVPGLPREPPHQSFFDIIDRLASSIDPNIVGNALNDNGDGESSTRISRQTVSIDPFLNCPSRHSEIVRANGVPERYAGEQDRLSDESRGPNQLYANMVETINIPQRFTETALDDLMYTFNVQRDQNGSLLLGGTTTGGSLTHVVRTAIRTLYSHLVETDSLVTLNSQSMREQHAGNVPLGRSGTAARIRQLSTTTGGASSSFPRATGRIYMDSATTETLNPRNSSTTQSTTAPNAATYTMRSAPATSSASSRLSAVGQSAEQMMTGISNAIFQMLGGIIEHITPSQQEQNPVEDRRIEGIMQPISDYIQQRSIGRFPQSLIGTILELMRVGVSPNDFLGMSRHSNAVRVLSSPSTQTAFRRHLVENQLNGNSRPSSSDLDSAANRIAASEAYLRSGLAPTGMLHEINLGGTIVDVAQAARFIEVQTVRELLNTVFERLEPFTERIFDSLRGYVRRLVALVYLATGRQRGELVRVIERILNSFSNHRMDGPHDRSSGETRRSSEINQFANFISSFHSQQDVENLTALLENDFLSRNTQTATAPSTSEVNFEVNNTSEEQRENRSPTVRDATSPADGEREPKRARRNSRDEEDAEMSRVTEDLSSRLQIFDENTRRVIEQDLALQPTSRHGRSDAYLLGLPAHLREQTSTINLYPVLVEVLGDPDLASEVSSTFSEAAIAAAVGMYQTRTLDRIANDPDFDPHRFPHLNGLLRKHESKR